LIADDFTFANVRLAVRAIAEHLTEKKKRPSVLVGYDTRFYSEEFSALAVRILQEHGIHTLLCETFTPTPAIAYEIQRRKLDGGINFTASHNPAQYHGLKFSSADAGPALPEVTKDIEARVARILAKEGASAGSASHDGHGKTDAGETVNLRSEYLKRLKELVRFEVIQKAKLKIVTDALHGAGAGYLDKALADHGIAVTARRTERDSARPGGLREGLGNILMPARADRFEDCRAPRGAFHTGHSVGPAANRIGLRRVAGRSARATISG